MRYEPKIYPAPRANRCISSGPGSGAVSEDGTRVSHSAILTLRKANMIQLTFGTSLHNPFTLTQPVPVVSIERMHEEFNYNE
jgi:hypothetical protein